MRSARRSGPSGRSRRSCGVRAQTSTCYERSFLYFKNQNISGGGLFLPTEPDLGGRSLVANWYTGGLDGIRRVIYHYISIRTRLAECRHSFSISNTVAIHAHDEVRDHHEDKGLHAEFVVKATLAVIYLKGYVYTRA